MKLAAKLSALTGAVMMGSLSMAFAQEATPDLSPPQAAISAPAPKGAATAFLRNALTMNDGFGHSAHFYPPVSSAPLAQAGFANPAGPLTYNGGSIMPTILIYNIFWKPAKLQSGAVANMSTHYMSVANGLAVDYAGHSIDSVNTQYYQIVGSKITYVSGLSAVGSGSSYGGSYLDTKPFPTSGCTSSATPGNCITDAQIQAEIKSVMTLKGWTGGLNKIFMLYTAQGEGSCFSSSGGAGNCAYTGYCAYHSSGTFGAAPLIYANEPYGVVANCQISGAPSPTGDPAADTAMTSASHEITEAISDPIPGTGWTDAAGYEIGDICAYIYGPNTYDGGKANQFWNGRFYELQEEWDNHAGACVQKGP